MLKTVQYGIDLGTTNSAIARMTPRGPEIVPIRRANYIPSAVAIDHRGDLKVGAEALNPQLAYARCFKRMMGTENRLTLGDGSTWTPERLSAEVLKSLAAAARLKGGEEVHHVVITVPAMFNQPQCAATNEAARIAGLEAVALLQEPIAAATAYLSADPVDGDYLVYDLGGGTFDVSLVRLRDGEMNVIEHGGDNYLGGADFDRAVFDWAVDRIRGAGGATSAFASGAPQRQLYSAVEEARLALSDEEEATIYLDEFDLPLTKLTLTRAQLEDLVSASVSRSIQIAKDRLHRSSSPRAVLLVGGPTQMPYVRQRLQQELGIPIAIDQDPMTVVAEGAAIHASSIRISTETVLPFEVRSEAATIELHYDPVSPEPTSSVVGRVTHPENFEGEVRLASTAGDWETGWQALRRGAFSSEVTLGRFGITEYRIELRDAQGRTIPTEPNAFAIRSGVRAAQAVTPYDYAVVLEGGVDRGVVVAAGSGLPASGLVEFQLAKTLRAGSEDLAMFYFVEGNSAFADENTKVGELALKGTDLERSLREGERVEIRIRMDESRRLKASVYIPLVDQEFAVEFATTLDTPAYDDLMMSLRETKESLAEVESYAGGEDQDTVLRAGRQLEIIEATFERAERGEAGEAERIQKQLADAKAELRPLRERYGLKALHDGIVDLLDATRSLAESFRDPMTLAKLGDLREDADRALRLEQRRSLEGIRVRVDDLFWPLFSRTFECWEYQLEGLKARAGLAHDRLSFDEHIHRAERALASEDLEGGRLAILRAWELLPETERATSRFHDAAVRR